jgi:uncharacterized protein (TIGR00369 family)
MDAVYPAAPPEFQQLDVGRGFVRLAGPMYLHARLPVFGVRVGADHVNLLQIAHGGYLATVADTALAAVLRRTLELAVPLVTVHLNLDYISPALEGDWLEAHVEVEKYGRRITNASCRLQVGERLVLRASGIFMAAGGAQSAPPPIPT